MANPEHLKILKQGVKVWNKWRNENPKIRPDLSEAVLVRRNLCGINLWDANLCGTDLRLANFFSDGRLFSTPSNLGSADLRGSNLCEANLHGTFLGSAKLSKANLRKANLSEAYLEAANLHDAKLNKARLIHAYLVRANLSGANLSRADFLLANLLMANLERANLRGSSLLFCSLAYSNLTKAILTGVKLYGTARDDWKIKDVECKYVYWDEQGKQRCPKDRDLEPGEFERLYAALPTIEYIFEKGMTPLDPLIMDRVVQAIRERRPEFDIKIDSINARGLAPSIKFTVQLEKHKEAALKKVKKEYEAKIKLLKAERDRYYQLVSRAIDTPKEIKLITAGSGAIVAMDGSTINIQAHIHNALELQKAIAKEPEDSESFGKVAKKKTLDIIGGVIEDIAKGQVKEAGKQIIELAKDLGPIIAKTAAYAFFKSML